MLRKICIVTLVSCMLFSGMSFAKISNSRIGIGGITIGSTAEFVTKTYGQPQVSKRSFYGPYGEYAYFTKYGDSFSVSYFENDGMVFLMSSTAQNGLKTPDGITVGDKASMLQRIYGTADLIQTDKSGEVHYWYLGDKNVKIIFHTKNGIITSISCGLE